jgi:hypothetical protein
MRNFGHPIISTQLEMRCRCMPWSYCPKGVKKSGIPSEASCYRYRSKRAYSIYLGQRVFSHGPVVAICIFAFLRFIFCFSYLFFVYLFYFFLFDVWRMRGYRGRDVDEAPLPGNHGMNRTLKSREMKAPISRRSGRFGGEKGMIHVNLCVLLFCLSCPALLFPRFFYLCTYPSP